MSNPLAVGVMDPRSMNVCLLLSSLSLTSSFVVHPVERFRASVMARRKAGAPLHWPSYEEDTLPSTVPSKTDLVRGDIELYAGGPLSSLWDNLPSFDPQGLLGGLYGSGGDADDNDDVSYVFNMRSSASLLREARRFLVSDLGLLDPTLLDDSDFVWISADRDQPLGKTDYLTLLSTVDLRTTFPDLDYRATDFRIVKDDKKSKKTKAAAANTRTVRCTVRITGTMRGALTLPDGNAVRSDEPNTMVIPPNGAAMQCPPEAISITYNSVGKVVKLCTGFCLDQWVGNTQGTTGLQAAAVVSGQSVSEWDLYPAPLVFQRFWGRPVSYLPAESTTLLAPFPEAVMIQLVKGILTANLGADDPTLLADDPDFEFSTPYLATPVRKAVFLKNHARQEFDGLSANFDHFRVDPLDPCRVWVDVTPDDGDKYKGAPQAMSFTFDEEGYCSRITSSYVMDPSIGNGGGLGGQEGYLYATGRKSPDWKTRPWGRALGRWQTRLLEPLTGVGPDDYVTPLQAQAARRATLVVNSRSSTNGSTDNGSDGTNNNMNADSSFTIRPSGKRESGTTLRPTPPPVETLPSAQLMGAKPPGPPPTPSQPALPKNRSPQALAAKAKLAEIQAARQGRFKEAEATRQAEEKAKRLRLEAQKAERDLQKLKAQEQRRLAQAARLQQKEAQRAAFERQKQAREEKVIQRKRELAQQEKLKARVAKTKQQNSDAQVARQEVLERAERQRAALEQLSKAVSEATISLLGLGGGADALLGTGGDSDDGLPAPPKGVPVLRRWRKNADGTITGIVSKSRNFSDGERVTTSAIANGNIQSGKIVRTASGTRYFLR